MFARWLLPKAGTKVIKSVKPGTKTGAKSVTEWKNKAAISRVKQGSFEFKEGMKKHIKDIKKLKKITGLD